MRRVYEALNMVEAQMCRDHLAERGIRSHVQGAYLQGGVGELPADVRPSVWVLDDRDYETARVLIEELLAPAERSGPWRCPGCGETVDPELAVCWRCGRSR